MLRLERKEGVRRQHVGVEGETVFLTRQCFSLIRFVTTRAALAWCAWLTFCRNFDEALDLTADLCTALFHSSNSQITSTTFLKQLVSRPKVAPLHLVFLYLFFRRKITEIDRAVIPSEVVRLEPYRPQFLKFGHVPLHPSRQ